MPLDMEFHPRRSVETGMASVSSQEQDGDDTSAGHAKVKPCQLEET